MLNMELTLHANMIVYVSCWFAL